MKNIWTWIRKNPNRAMFLVPILLVAIISISHVVSFYDMANPHNWAIYLSIAIEVGAITALVAATNRIKGGIWFMFGLVTFIQLVGNIFYSYKEIDPNGELFKSWVELSLPVWEMLGTEPDDIVGLKRWLAFLAGGFLPLISLTSLHFFVKYETKEEANKKDSDVESEELEDKKSEEMEESKAESVKATTPSSDEFNVVEVLESDSPNVEESVSEPEFSEVKILPFIDGQELKKENLEESISQTENEENSEEEILDNIVISEEKKESFDDFVEKKKKKLERDKKIFEPLLDVLFLYDNVKKGDALPSYVDFRSKVDPKFTDDNIKMFLTLCNYLEITELSDNTRKAKVDYNEASAIMNKYLSLEDIKNDNSITENNTSKNQSENTQQPQDWWSNSKGKKK